MSKPLLYVLMSVSQLPHDIWYTQCPAVHPSETAAAQHQPVVAQLPQCCTQHRNANNATLTYDNGVEHDK